MLRAAVPLLLLAAGLAVVPRLSAQVPLTFNVPGETAAKIMNAHFEMCRIAENASSKAELDGLDVALQRYMEQYDGYVRRLVADSATALAADAALRRAEASLGPLETQIGPLHVRRNEINSAQKPFEDELAATIRGDNPARLSLDDVNAQIKSLEEEIARLKAALAEFMKKHPNPSWLEGRHEELGAAIAKKEGELTALGDKRLTILRSILRVRLNPEFERLVREENDLDQRIKNLEDRINPLREARDAARKARGDADLAAIRNLEQLHEINGFLSQYLSATRDCVDRRRGQLAQAVPPPVTPPTGGPPADDLLSGTAVGRWTVNCSFTEGYSADKVYTDGGVFHVTFDGAGGVSGNFVSSTGQLAAANYPVVGALTPDPDPMTGRRVKVEYGQGQGAGWTMTWDGLFGTRDGQFFGYGTPRLHIEKWGGGDCTAAWSVP